MQSLTFKQKANKTIYWKDSFYLNDSTEDY